MNLLDILRDMIKGKPILFLLIFFIVGCLLGWWVMGYIVWPVQYAGEAHSYELTAPEKEKYVVMVADSYKMTGDGIEAQRQFAGWNSSEIGPFLANVAASLRAQGRTDQAQRVEGVDAPRLSVAKDLLADLLQVLDHGADDVGLAREVAVEGGHGDAETRGEVAVGEALHAAFRDQGQRLLNDLLLTRGAQRDAPRWRGW